MTAITDALSAPSAELDARLEILRERVARSAERSGLVDVAYRTVDSPVGPLLLAATERGVVRVAFQQAGFDQALAELSDRVSPRVLCLPRRLDPAVRELEEYFSRRRREFEVSLDLSLAQGFRHTVLDQLRHIAYGRRRSYAEIAAAVQRPRAVRAVGTACARNPVPILVPCHRVVRSDGTIGQYAGGAQAKKLLLGLEAA